MTTIGKVGGTGPSGGPPTALAKAATASAVTARGGVGGRRGRPGRRRSACRRP
ncbi:hypothetical protein [Nocardioides convexus]|uniref:hypothetical protein n=1 Tax=Nocardioides convexus TaxID=2712224 RepID=UPI0024188025|nr:hypothetical protein [Nocardioides convexus]